VSAAAAPPSPAGRALATARRHAGRVRSTPGSSSRPAARGRLQRARRFPLVGRRTSSHPDHDQQTDRAGAGTPWAAWRSRRKQSGAGPNAGVIRSRRKRSPRQHRTAHRGRCCSPRPGSAVRGSGTVAGNGSDAQTDAACSRKGVHERRAARAMNAPARIDLHHHFSRRKSAGSICADLEALRPLAGFPENFPWSPETSVRFRIGSGSGLHPLIDRAAPAATESGSPTERSRPHQHRGPPRRRTPRDHPWSLRLLRHLPIPTLHPRRRWKSSPMRWSPRGGRVNLSPPTQGDEARYVGHATSIPIWGARSSRAAALNPRRQKPGSNRPPNPAGA